MIFVENLKSNLRFTQPFPYNIKLKDMASSKYILALLLLILPMMVFAQFEGEIEMTTFNASNNENAALTWSIKDGKHLMDIESQADDYVMDYKVLINEKKKEAWFLSADKNPEGAYTIPYAQFEESELNLPLNSIVKDSGISEKIAGADCQKYQIISSTYIVDCWVSDEVGMTHSDFPAFMNTGDLLGLFKLNKIRGIPLKFEVKDAAGNLVLGQYMNKITAKKLADSIFEAPSKNTENSGTSK